MATEEDLEKAKTDDEAADEAEESEDTSKPETAEIRTKTQDELDAEEAGKADDAAREAAASPLQLGYTRFVYAAYMGGAMLVAFLVAKAGHLAWYRAGQWKP